MSPAAGTPFLRRDASRPDLRYHCRWRDQTASPAPRAVLPVIRSGGFVLRVFLSAALTTLGLCASAIGANAEMINCTVIRENLCFPTGCRNNAKSERVMLDLEASSLTTCPQRVGDANCLTVQIDFRLNDNSVIGATLAGTEVSVRSVFLNRNTGSLTTTLVSAGGVTAVDFGNCDVRR